MARSRTSLRQDPPAKSALVSREPRWSVGSNWPIDPVPIAWMLAVAVTAFAITITLSEVRFHFGTFGMGAQAVAGVMLLGAGLMLAIRPRLPSVRFSNGALTRLMLPGGLLAAGVLLLLAATGAEGWRAWIARRGVWPTSVTVVAIVGPLLIAATLLGAAITTALSRASRMMRPRGARSGEEVTKSLAGAGLALIGLSLAVGAIDAPAEAVRRAASWSDEATIQLDGDGLWRQAGVLDVCARPLSTLTILGDVELAAPAGETRRFVRRISRSLRPGGRVIVRYDATSDRVPHIEAFVARLAVDSGFRVFRAIRTDREAAMVVGLDAGGWVAHRLEQGYAVREMALETAARLGAHE